MNVPTSAHNLEGTTPHLETTPLHIKGILAATDLSEQATMGVKIAALLAKQLHSRLHVLYTVSPQLYVANTAGLSAELLKVEAERAQSDLHDYASKIPELRAVRYEEIALCGPTTETIMDVVEMKGIDLLVVGSRGRSGIKKMILGSVSESAIRRMSCPVLVIGPHCLPNSHSLKSMVLATASSDGSLRAAQYAMSIAKEANVALTVLRVLQGNAEPLGISGVAAKNHAREEMRQMAPNDIELKRHLEFEVAAGDPAEEILSVAKKKKAGIIVMGARQRSIAADHAPWSTLSAVIRKATCPVLAVQPHIA